MVQDNRRVTYKLYPSPQQADRSDKLCELHRHLYNAALQERVEAWQRARLSIGYNAQCESLTIIRRAHPEYLALNAQSAQVTLKRLDEAFKHFFRRAKQGDTPGFRRFKNRGRFAGFGFKTHGDGFRFTPGDNWRHGHLRLTGVGTIQARGKARVPGTISSADIQRRAGGWYLSLVIECTAQRERTGDRMVGLDRGVHTFAPLADAPGDYNAVENRRHLAQGQMALRDEQRALSLALRGTQSTRAARERNALARRHRKIANQRNNRLQQVTARLLREHGLIVTEDLAIKNMTASAKGRLERPGRHVAQKAGLNRSILDTAPGSFLSMLRYKAEAAGSEVIMPDTRKHKPSQTCPACSAVQKKALSKREHSCPACGFRASRDQAAALSMLIAGLKHKGREPGFWPQGQETHPRAV
jgi:putative transposase